ncbi:hypothetical protein Q7O_003600 [Pectobacterium carotovorum subsp. carotovorum PCCS1]|nr:hypothetical protein [Pectobacterium carotovorum subsp. carotovorum PCCS1]
MASLIIFFYFYNVIPWCWITFYCSHVLLKKLTKKSLINIR